MKLIQLLTNLRTNRLKKEPPVRVIGMGRRSAVEALARSGLVSVRRTVRQGWGGVARLRGWLNPLLVGFRNLFNKRGSS